MERKGALGAFAMYMVEESIAAAGWLWFLKLRGEKVLRGIEPYLLLSF